MARRITSIASAPGWKARYLADHEVEARAVTLVTWALVEGSDGSSEIVGVVQRPPTDEQPAGRLQLADEVDDFQGYTFTGLATRPGNS